MKNNSTSCVLGMIGLGVMGRNLLLNMADHGFKVAGYDKDTSKVISLREEALDRDVQPAEDIAKFIRLLKRPRNIMLLVPAGGPVDAVIEDLLPHLHEQDLIIDGGNSYFKDTDQRAQRLKQKGILFCGTGISGGEEGARLGPSIMPGGPKEAYIRVQSILEAVAAKVGDDPCVAYLGPDSAGHYVKMVHNGIEYGVMQLIAETYALLKLGLGLNNQQLSKVYEDWNSSELNSYLLEITSRIFTKPDEQSSGDLIDKILAVARQKGTGNWASQSALELQSPTPSIDIAVCIRDLSVFIEQRDQANALYKDVLSHPRSRDQVVGDRDEFIAHLRHAFFAAMIIVYAQGFALLSAASEAYHYNLNLELVARIWRGGCIIRTQFLEEIRKAFTAKSSLSHILLDLNIADILKKNQQYLRKIICRAVEIGLPVPGMSSALEYFDAYRSGWLPANLIQAQRDYFGAHTYERIDKPGVFHTEW